VSRRSKRIRRSQPIAEDRTRASTVSLSTVTASRRTIFRGHDFSPCVKMSEEPCHRLVRLKTSGPRGTLQICVMTRSSAIGLAPRQQPAPSGRDCRASERLGLKARRGAQARFAYRGRWTAFAGASPRARGSPAHGVFIPHREGGWALGGLWAGRMGIETRCGRRLSQTPRVHWSSTTSRPPRPPTSSSSPMSQPRG